MPKFNTKLEVIGQSGGIYNTNKKIRFKLSILRLDLRHFSNAYIVLKGKTTVQERAGTNRYIDTYNIKVILNNCAPLTSCIWKINYILIDNAEDLDILMSMYNLIEYSKNHSKMSVSLQNH